MFNVVKAASSASEPFLEDVVGDVLSSAGRDRQLTPVSPLAGVEDLDRRIWPKINSLILRWYAGLLFYPLESQQLFWNIFDLENTINILFILKGPNVSCSSFREDIPLARLMGSKRAVDQTDLELIHMSVRFLFISFIRMVPYHLCNQIIACFQALAWATNLHKNPLTLI